jgi:hypothetical protein
VKQKQNTFGLTGIWGIDRAIVRDTTVTYTIRINKLQVDTEESL